MGQLKYHNGTTWVPLQDVGSDFTSFFVNDVLQGVQNGINTSLTTSRAFTSVTVYKNGQRLTPGSGNDYTVSGSNTIVLVVPPVADDVFTADYTTTSTYTVTGSNSLVRKQTVTGLINGVNASYTTAVAYMGGTLEVFVNGIRQGISHVTETSPAAGTFTLDKAPDTGDVVEVAYMIAAVPFGNADSVDSFHASQTTTPNTIPVSDASGRLPMATTEHAWARLTHSGRPVVNAAAVYTRYKIPCDTGLVGSAQGLFTFDAANNRIVVGNGVSKVKVSMMATTYTGPATAELTPTIMKNGSSVPGLAITNHALNELRPVSIPPKTITVTSGDYFELWFSSAATGSYTWIFDNDTAGWLEIEAVA